MNEQINQTNGTERPRTFPWTPVLAVVILAPAVSPFFYENGQTEDLRRQVVAFQQDNAALRSSLSQSDSELQTALDAVRADLASTRQDTSSAVAKAQASVRKHADLLAGRISSSRSSRANSFRPS